jgi:hypothetical protein
VNAVGGFSALIIGVLRSYDHRNYYKVEKWTKDGAKIERMLYAGSNLDKAQAIFAPPSSIGRASGLPFGSGRGSESMAGKVILSRQISPDVSGWIIRTRTITA